MEKIKHYVIELKDESDENMVYDLDFFGHPEVKDNLLDALNNGTGWLKATVTEESEEEFEHFRIEVWDGNDEQTTWQGQKTIEEIS